MIDGSLFLADGKSHGGRSESTGRTKEKGKGSELHDVDDDIETTKGKSVLE